MQVEKTHFSNKMGVYCPNTETITWEADNGVRIVSYVKGRGGKCEYPQYEKGAYLDVMVKLANEAFSRGEGILSQTVKISIWPLTRTCYWHLVFDPDLIPIITSFTRHPQAEESVLAGEFNPALENDLSTPFYCVRSKEMMHQLGLPFSSFCLPPESYAVFHKSVVDYFKLWIKEHYQSWATHADIMYFENWWKEDSIEGHPAFSSVAWKTVSKFILGVTEGDFEDYAYIWNTLLDYTKGFPRQAWTVLWYFPQLQNYILNTIRTERAVYTGMPQDLISYWLDNDIAAKILEKLPLSMREEAEKMAEKRLMSVEEMILIDNFCVVMVGMQENIAFILTEIVARFAKDEMLAEKCQESDSACEALVHDVLKELPPAGTSREVRFDSDVIANGVTYPINKGDQLLTHPVVTARMEAFADKCVQTFSEGPHRCPGQVVANRWLAALTKKLAQYKFVMESDEAPDYFTAFILRDGGRKFQMYNKYRYIGEEG